MILFSATMRSLVVVLVVGCTSSTAVPFPEIYSKAVCTGGGLETLACALEQVDEVLLGRITAVRGYTSLAARTTVFGYYLTEQCARVKMALELDMVVLKSFKTGLSGPITVRIGPTQLDYYAPTPVGINCDGIVQWVGTSPYGSEFRVGAEVGVLLTRIGSGSHSVWTVLSDPMFYIENGCIRVQRMRECSKHGLLEAEGKPLSFIQAAIDSPPNCQAYRSKHFGFWSPICLNDKP